MVRAELGITELRVRVLPEPGTLVGRDVVVVGRVDVVVVGRCVGVLLEDGRAPEEGAVVVGRGVVGVDGLADGAGEEDDGAL